MKKIPVAILGATGSVGQMFIRLLDGHPWFEITAITASPTSVGKKYHEAVNWIQGGCPPAAIAEMTLRSNDDFLAAKLLFSALDASVAGDIETHYSHKGYFIISNAKNHRMDTDVPLLLPMINPTHFALIDAQPEKGKIITNPNCSTTGLVTALKPLQDLFGLQSVHVVTMQALSGAGYPGVSSLDIIDNLIPFIAGEEEKIENETLKLLGDLDNDTIRNASINVTAQCNRVAVIDGHSESVSIHLEQPATPEDIIEAWSAFQPGSLITPLPSTPEYPIIYHHESHYPQPRLHRMLGKGMAVSIGRLRQRSTAHFTFSLLVHNTILGAAGAAIHNGELLASKKGWI